MELHEEDKASKTVGYFIKRLIDAKEHYLAVRDSKAGELALGIQNQLASELLIILVCDVYGINVPPLLSYSKEELELYLTEREEKGK